ncbi:PLP-dependent transferase [Thelephora ganbajun]|uniref:PLP-dependent transferase n=1 Tax=Thelephora ganbajun TaxID=370292 RepID=A0ACB6ZH12_THEGA|nr:PLP-dependent transferase [Thelephora ganbajun]
MANFLPKEYYNKFLSDVSKSRIPSPIRSLMPLENKPGLISMLAGKPNSSTFPFTSIQLTARSPTDPTKEEVLTLGPKELETALQYGPTAGMPSLLEWIWGLQEYAHGRKRGEGWRPSVGAGSQDVIYKAVNAILNPGDSVLVESPVYAGVIPMFKAHGCKLVEVETDGNGIQSSSLRGILENWPAGTPKPKVLYSVPYGCNPSGATATVERKRETLELARKHDILIFEDDPYYFLYFGTKSRPPSYFTLELEQPEAGRVLRFDSLSKILSSGIRIGFISGPEPLVNAMDMHTATANLQVSTLTQEITSVLLRSWGYDGFKAHTEVVSDFYRQKRDAFERALRTHLDGLAEWVTPEAGMFIWFKLLIGDKPGEEGDSFDLVRNKAFENGVLALPGTVFLPDGRRTAYVRASFSLLSEEDVNEALRRLRVTILKARK